MSDVAKRGEEAAALFAVGRREEVLPFAALGARIVEAPGDPEALRALEELAAAASGVVLVSEGLALRLGGALEDLRAGSSAVAILAVPTRRGETRRSFEETRRLAARALGKDLPAED